MIGDRRSTINQSKREKRKGIIFDRIHRMDRILERDGFLRGGTEGKLGGRVFTAKYTNGTEGGNGFARGGARFAYMRTSEVRSNVNKEI